MFAAHEPPGKYKTTRCDVKHDIWSFGMFMWEVLDGAPFFTSDEQAKNALLQLADQYVLAELFAGGALVVCGGFWLMCAFFHVMSQAQHVLV